MLIFTKRLSHTLVTSDEKSCQTHKTAPAMNYGSLNDRKKKMLKANRALKKSNLEMEAASNELKHYQNLKKELCELDKSRLMKIENFDF